MTLSDPRATSSSSPRSRGLDDAGSRSEEVTLDAARGESPAMNAASALEDALSGARLGTTLEGRWTVVRSLGSGGMGHVFEGVHRNGLRVAIKILRAELCSDDDVVRRFRREAYLANRVRHPLAISVLDDGLTDDGAPYLVMPLLEGQSLSALLEGEGPLSFEEVRRVADVVLDVLSSAHAKGILHRDLKPGNLMRSHDGAIHVLDFGIARTLDPEGDAPQTNTFATIGTLAFMSPEQARGRSKELDARADLFSLAATLYTLLSGKIVHAASTRNELLLCAMSKPVPAVREQLPDLPEAFAAWLDRGLAFDREDRFPSAEAMQRELHAMFPEQATASRRYLAAPSRLDRREGASEEVRTRPRTVVLWAIGAGALVLGGGLVVGVGFRRESSVPYATGPGASARPHDSAFVAASRASASLEAAVSSALPVSDSLSSTPRAPEGTVDAGSPLERDASRHGRPAGDASSAGRDRTSGTHSAAPLPVGDILDRRL